MRLEWDAVGRAGMQASFGAGLGDEDGREIRDSVRGDGFQKEASREPWEVSEQWMDTPEPFQRSVPPDHKRSRRREIYSLLVFLE